MFMGIVLQDSFEVVHTNRLTFCSVNHQASILACFSGLGKGPRTQEPKDVRGLTSLQQSLCFRPVTVWHV